MASKKQKQRRRRKNLVLAGLGGTAAIGTGVAIARSRKSQSAPTQSSRQQRLDNLNRRMRNNKKTKTASSNNPTTSIVDKKRKNDAIQEIRNQRDLIVKKADKSIETSRKRGNLSYTNRAQSKLSANNLKLVPRRERRYAAAQIRQANGGRKSTRTNYLVNRKDKRTSNVRNRRGRGISRLSGKQRNRLENQLGYDTANQRLRKGTSKSNKRKVTRILKGLGRFNRRHQLSYF